jgi:CysZ protein
MSFLVRGANIGIVCFIKQIFVMIVLFVLEIFIPPIVIISPIIIFLMQGYFTGFAFMDYTLERYKFTTKESMKFLSKKRIYSILCGTIFNILIFIPVIGIFIAPITTCVAVTKLTLDLINNDKEYEKYTIIG